MVVKLLVDSQISAQVAAWLRRTGHDVREVREDPALRGAPDIMLVQTAWREGRVLLSGSRAFARLISRQSEWRPGAILLLAGDPRPRVQQRTLQELLQRVPEAKLATSLIVIEGHRARIYPLAAHAIEPLTPELQPRSREPLLSPPISTSPVVPSNACPVCGYTLKLLHANTQICPACGYLSSASMD